MNSATAQADYATLCLTHSPRWERLCELREELDNELVNAVLHEAAKFSDKIISPLNSIADSIGCTLENGCVTTPEQYKPAYQKFADNGWLGLEHSECYDGQNLPISLFLAADPLFERACPAFMMVAGGSRSACLLLAEHAPKALAQEWIPKIIKGQYAATICISESDAGSDLGRIRTRATATTNNTWTLNGNKQWISFGGHDLTDNIGHCVLARTTDTRGTRGLSLFFVPTLREDGNSNCVTVERIEEKLGLHGSPTCALNFTDSQATLLGEAERGLPTLFSMIRHMRLITGAQGLGVGWVCYEHALEYAQTRRQGGSAKSAPVPIIRHTEINRQLKQAHHQLKILYQAALETALAMDLQKSEQDATECAKQADFAAWMLPMIKAFGAETGFNLANTAVGIFGGVGYTQGYPVAQALRDSRVFSIYEGTTAMQAMDFLYRRLWANNGTSVSLFLAMARSDIDPETHNGAVALRVLEKYSQLSIDMLSFKDQPRIGESIADSYIRASWAAVNAWLSASRFQQSISDTELNSRMAEIEISFTRYSQLCSLYSE